MISCAPPLSPELAKQGKKNRAKSILDGAKSFLLRPKIFLKRLKIFLEHSGFILERSKNSQIMK
jgi:hypothetical protein